MFGPIWLSLVSRIETKASGISTLGFVTGTVAGGGSAAFVTLPCREREVSALRELLGRCGCSPPRCHRDTAKRAVRLGGDEMALDVEGVVNGGVG